MQLDKSALQRNAERSKQQGGWRLWEELVFHTLFEIESLAFRLSVLIPGHYPLFAPLDRAIASYRDAGGGMEAFVLTDRMYADDGKSGDHAAAFETSLMLALEEELVDLGALDPDPAMPPTGVLGEDPRVHASKEFGEQILKKFTEIVGERIALVR